MNLVIPTPKEFSFKRTVLSHGWCELPPFHFDPQKWVLSRVVAVDGAAPIEVAIAQKGASIDVAISGKIGKKQSTALAQSIRYMLRLDESFNDFYALVSDDPDFSWIPAQGAGRLLRAPTVFEDLVKMICTTNCSWALTSKMVGVLVSTLGEPSKRGRRTFPTPQAMSKMPVRFYRDKVGAGYRSGYLKELADMVASNEIDVEGWLKSDLPTSELKKEIKRVKGAGDYVAENILKLLGRYDGLALDSWVRGKFSKMHAKGRAVTDKKIARHYSRFGPWVGLALWCDMTRDWMGEAGTVEI